MIKLDPYLIPYTRITPSGSGHLKYIKESKQALEENIGEFLSPQPTERLSVTQNPGATNNKRLTKLAIFTYL